MCGLAALIGKPGVNVAPLIDAMTQLVTHRGPDDEGFAFVRSRHEPKPYFLAGDDTPNEMFRSTVRHAPTRHIRSASNEIGQIAVGHRRLAIIDNSIHGHQPLTFGDDSQIIIFSGEVYNFGELRAQLQQLGYVFSSTGDAEVILASYRAWGEQCLNKFRGMFAIVIIDVRRWRFFVARDRFGIKPLYYWASPAGFLAIASEIKQFAVLPGWTPRVEESGAYEFLAWGLSDHRAGTMFDSVFQLKAGHFAEGDLDAAANNMPVRQWYWLPTSIDNENDFELNRNQLQSVLSDSVRLHSRSDVPIGISLSGGIDSSSIWAAHQSLVLSGYVPALLGTFSSVYDDSLFDESHHVDSLLENACIKSYRVSPTPEELIANLGLIAWHQDEPYGGPSVFAEWKMYQTAHEANCVVTLDGHGADELLFGYHDYMYASLAQMFVRGQLGRARKLAISMRSHHDVGYGRMFARTADAVAPVHVSQFARWATNHVSAKPSWVRREFWSHQKFLPQSVRHVGTSSLNQMSRDQIVTTSIPSQLRWTDRSAMAHSVESRLPFLDHHLVEFLVNVPSDQKLFRGVTKHLLREAMRGSIPETIVDRRDKMGFIVPENLWMTGDNGPVFAALAHEAVERGHKFIDPSAHRMVASVSRSMSDYRRAYWRIISFGEWMKAFNLR